MSEQPDYVETYDLLWKDIVENPDGTLNLDRVMRELCDYATVMEQVSLAYADVTGGKLSKPNTAARHIVDAVNERIDEAVQTALEQRELAEEDHDPRYARTTEMRAVMRWDKHDEVEVVCATEALAHRYIDGQWSDEYLSIQPVQVVWALPVQRPLYILTGHVPQDPDQEPTRELNDFAAEGEFPGLGNGAMVPLDQVDSSVKERPQAGSWHVSAVGWDREQVEAVFASGMAEARTARDARLEAFRRYTDGTVVETEDGERLVRSITPYGPRWVEVGDPRQVRYDADVDPAALIIIAPGKTS